MARAAMRLTGTTPPSAVSRVITVAPWEVPQQRDLHFRLTHHPLLEGLMLLSALHLFLAAERLGTVLHEVFLPLRQRNRVYAVGACDLRVRSCWSHLNTTWNFSCTE